MRVTRVLDRPNLAVSIGLGLLALLLLGALYISGSQQQAQALVAHTLDVEKRLASIYSRLQTAESGQRGYLITGDPAYLRPYDQNAARLPQELRALEAAVADNPAQQGSAVRLDPLITQHLASLKQGIVHRSLGDLEAAADSVRSGEGSRIMEAIRLELGGLQAEQARLLSQRQMAARTTTFSLRFALVAGFFAVMLITVFGVRQSRRRLRAQIAARRELAEINARLVAEAEQREQAEAQVRQMQKMEAIGQLTGGVAHDFNNMLSIVIGSLDLARRRIRTDLGRAEASIDQALEGARRAATLTARLLAFSRRQALAPTVIAPNVLVEGMSDLLKRTLGDNVKVETVVDPDVWNTSADTSQLENAILNLAINARDAMPDGGVLTIETFNTSLTSERLPPDSSSTAGDYIGIAVMDSGVGMPSDVLHHVFEPFFTTKSVGKGTGLGLSQVYGFVRQSGGHVEVKSEPGRGAAVTLYLPRWSGDAPEPPLGRAAHATAPGGAETILVVEDDPQVRQMSVAALRELGYAVLEASHAEMALDMLDHFRAVDLLFTDVVMPGMNGLKLTEAAKKLRPGIRILYTTGYARDAVLESGAAYLPKPFTLEELATKVRQALDVAYAT